MKAFIVFATILVIGARAQARADWNSTITASNPMNWYRFNEASGSVAVDYGSAHSNGTYGTGLLDAARGVPGPIGKGVQFGNQSTVILGQPDLTGNWSAEFVLERIGEKRSSVLIRGFPYAVPSTALKLEQYNSTEQIGFTQYNVSDYTFSPSVPTPLNQWVDIVYVNRAGSGMSLYLDGVLVGTNPTSISLSRYQIGSDADVIPESPLMNIDAAVIYDRALSPTEIALHAAAVPEPSTFFLAAVAVCILLAHGRRNAQISGT